MSLHIALASDKPSPAPRVLASWQALSHDSLRAGRSCLAALNCRPGRLKQFGGRIDGRNWRICPFDNFVVSTSIIPHPPMLYVLFFDTYQLLQHLYKNHLTDLILFLSMLHDSVCFVV